MKPAEVLNYGSYRAGNLCREQRILITNANAVRYSLTPGSR